MPQVRFEISMSLDGYAAGPDQSEEAPLGVGGEQLHEWVIELKAWREAHGMEGGVENASSAVVERSVVGRGATIMGRNMFGGGPGPWGEPAWNGWWGDEPPFHHPVFVITHHAREPLVLQGGTTFTFVTDGIEAALEQARAAAGDGDVHIAGGADVANQYLRAGLVDDVLLNVAPVVLGAGERPLDGVPQAGVRLELVETVVGPKATHFRYRVGR
jgi:dihydrofolate reductase